jgi:tetrachloro-p-hydroquinone reductive dehalogenase
VTDSAVIMRYAAEQFEGAELIPRDPETLARMEYWYGLGDSLDFRLFSFSNMPKKLTDFGLDKKITKLRKYAQKYPELRAEYQAKLLDIQGLETAKSDVASVAEGARKLEAALDEMNLALETQPFVAGDRYTLADVIWTVALTRIEALERIELVEARPNVLGYYRRMQERPSYRKADLWPRISALTLLPFIVRVMGPRLVKPLLVVTGIAALVWCLSRA